MSHDDDDDDRDTDTRTTMAACPAAGTMSSTHHDEDDEVLSASTVVMAVSNDENSNQNITGNRRWRRRPASSANVPYSPLEIDNGNGAPSATAALSQAASASLNHFDSSGDAERRGSSSSSGKRGAVVQVVGRVAKGEARWLVVTRYVSLAALAVALTLTCPGDTVLWMTPAAATSNSSNSSNLTNGDKQEQQLLLQWTVVLHVVAASMLTLTAFLVVHCSDPGYLTPEIMLRVATAANNHNMLEEDEADSTKNNHEQLSLISGADHETSNTLPDQQPLPPSSYNEYGDDPLSNEATTDRGGPRRKPCQVCQLPDVAAAAAADPHRLLVVVLRSHHCKVCGKCVATFDHHCNLLGVCIGERNRCQFWWFLLVQWYAFRTCCNVVGSSSLGVWSALLLLNQTDGTSNGDDDGAVISYTAVMRVAVAKLYLYLLFAFAAIMLGVHTFFALTNMTTFECAKGPRRLDYLKGTRDMDLPFSRGLVQNLCFFCCRHRHDAASASSYADCQQQQQWTPTLWKMPGEIVRDSEDWWEHPWQNKYWSCC